MNIPSPEALVLALPTIGGPELLLILVIVLIVFGHNRIPQLGDALGKGIRNFRRSFSKDDTETPAQPVQREIRELPDDPAPAVDEKLRQAKPEESKSSADT